ncbi:MAG: ECF-type riboflavin transporter substrate-binding protein [Lachnospiraceae bacterium]|nr:ECF-type riboflavin transporter substrate-binding protein [Lachnospiraceae bacterium]
MKKFGVKHIVATGIGAALFFVLGRFVAIPSGIPNTNISIQYGLLAFISAVFGPIAGLLSGLIGHFFIDFSFGWGIWWSWVIASAICGGLIGLLTSKLKIEEGEFDKGSIVKFNFFQLVSQLVSWAVIAPVLDIVMYGEPVNKVFIQGLVSAGVNIVTTAVVGTLLCIAYAASIPKKGSLKEED